MSADHDPGFVRMVIRALTRWLNAEEKKKNATPDKKQTDRFVNWRLTDTALAQRLGVTRQAVSWAAPPAEN